MKKYLALLFAFTLIAASCGDDDGDGVAPEPAVEAPAPEVPEPDEPAAEEPAAEEPEAEEPAAEEPAAEEPEAEEPERSALVGFANILRTGCEFCVNVEDGVERDIGGAGYDVFAVDHNLDANQMLANADAMVTRGVDIYLNFDGGITNYEATIEKMAEAGIPMIFIDGALPPDVPDVYWFGAHGETAGTLMGEYAVSYINENWGGQLDGVFGVWQGNWPDDIKQRLVAAVNVISQSFPEWTMDTITISDAVLEGEETQAAASAYLNANPDAANLLFLTTTNDIAGLAVVAAMEQLDRLDHGVILSHGGDSNAVAEIRDESSPFIMSIGYFPDRYGEFMLPMIDAIFAGETPAKVTYVGHEPIDINNVNELYPEG